MFRFNKNLPTLWPKLNNQNQVLSCLNRQQKTNNFRNKNLLPHAEQDPLPQSRFTIEKQIFGINLNMIMVFDIKSVSRT